MDLFVPSDGVLGMRRKDAFFLTLLPCLGSALVGVIATKSPPVAAGVAAGGAVSALGILRRQRRIVQKKLTAAKVAAESSNRASFFDRANESLALDDRTAMAALLVIDVRRVRTDGDDGRREVTDTMLAAAGPRLRGTLRDGDVVGRLGYDEFAVLVRGVRNDADLVAVSQRLVVILSEPFDVQGQPLNVKARVGAAVVEPDSTEVVDLLPKADIALSIAKRDDVDVVVYRDDIESSRPAESDILVELRDAIDRKELILHYQPKFELATGYPVGVEGLVRWNHPSGRLVPPLEFIGPAEESSLIHPLTRYVLDSALSQCRTWMDRGWSLPVAVNVSANCFADRNFAEGVCQSLARHHVQPKLLTLEITEATIESEPGRVCSQLQFLREQGVRVALGAYGVGYSTLAKLKTLPIDELKIDRSLVSNLTSDAHDRALITAILDLGAGLGLSVIAEGAEDAVTCELLLEIGCEIAQGFQWMRPMPAAELDVFLTNAMRIAGAAAASSLL